MAYHRISWYVGGIKPTTSQRHPEAPSLRSQQAMVNRSVSDQSPVFELHFFEIPKKGDVLGFFKPLEFDNSSLFLNARSLTFHDITSVHLENCHQYFLV